jgi:hypothetical protein
MGDAGLAGCAGTCARKERAVMTDPDRWHRWLLEVRFGGDAAAREKPLVESGAGLERTALAYLTAVKD